MLQMLLANRTLYAMWRVADISSIDANNGNPSL